MNQDLKEELKKEGLTEKIVVGANTLAHFNVRCPSCRKLYRIDSREIASSQPQFDCHSCKTRFSFDFPPLSAQQIETRIVSLKQVMENLNSEAACSAAEGKSEKSNDLKRCPKCEAMNPQLRKECLKCGVLFEKIESLPLDSTLGAFPSLVKAWQDLMQDYTNVTKHMAFVDQCEDLQALPFALKKYQTLKEVQPGDNVARQMLHQVIMRKFSRKVDKINWLSKTRDFILQVNGNINWPRVRKLAPFALSFALVMVGLSNDAARNMIGLGAACLFLTLGLTIFIKGRISSEDFW